MEFFLTIAGKIDSKALYREVRGFRANVMDLDVATYIYGEASSEEVSAIEKICEGYGEVIKQGGVANGKEEKEKEAESVQFD